AGLNWQAQLNSTGEASMQHLAGLFTSVAWQNLVPDWNHVVLTSGYGTWGGTDYAAAERTSDGTLAIAYLPTVRTVTIDMSQLSGSVTAQWYDPSAGTYSTVVGSPF